MVVILETIPPRHQLVSLSRVAIKYLKHTHKKPAYMLQRQQEGDMLFPGGQGQRRWGG